jgi:hypothetical protein
VKNREEEVALVGQVGLGWEEPVASEAVEGVWREALEEVGVC